MKSELIEPETLNMYESTAIEVLEDMLKEYFENEGIDVDSLNIKITINTEIKEE